VNETRKLAAILVIDVVGYSRLAGANEDRILARLRTLRSDPIDPTIAMHHRCILLFLASERFAPGARPLFLVGRK
jgi:class 3 adenylate cyclase